MITTNVIHFIADLKQFAETLQSEVVTAEKYVVHSLIRKLGERTPKDTERATANWNVSIGEPDYSVLPEGKYPDSPRRIRDRAQAVLNGLEKPEVIYISNATPYIGPLAAGHSAQAPDGWIEKAVAEVEVEAGLEAWQSRV